MRRIDANRDVYEQWPIEMRQAVLDGKAEEGMTPEMIEMALGKPTEITSRNGGDEVWIYRTGGVQQDPGMMMPGPSYPGGGYPGTYPGGGYPYPNSGYPQGGGIGISTGRGGGISVMPPSVGIGVGSGGTVIGPGVGGGYPGGMYPGGTLPPTRTPIEEREIVFRNGVVVHADPGPEK